MLLKHDMYVYWCRFDEGSNVLQDIFWTQPSSLKLLNSFYIVLIMDSTYKINKYMIPLLKVVGITSKRLTFSYAFALL